MLQVAPAAIPLLDLNVKVVSLVFLGLIGFATLMYRVAPFLIMRWIKIEARPRAVRFELDDYHWPEEADDLFRLTTGLLNPLGFETAGGFFLPSTIPSVKTAGVLLINREQRDAAMVVAIYCLPITSDSIRNLYLEFFTESNDGQEFATNNSHEFSSFPIPSRKTLTQLPQIKNPLQLYHIHEAVMSRAGLAVHHKSFKFDSEFKGDVIAYVQNSMQEELQSAANNGYLREAGDDHYRPTFTGAHLMVWKELWPWKSIRCQRRDRKAAKLLDDLKRQGLKLSDA